MNYFEEAFTSSHWMVRIFRVKKKGNRDGVKFEEMKKKKSIQELSGLDSGIDNNSLQIKHKYGTKIKF